MGYYIPLHVGYYIPPHPKRVATLPCDKVVKFNYRFSRNLLLRLSVKELENRLAFGKNSDTFFRIRRILPLRQNADILFYLSYISFFSFRL